MEYTELNIEVFSDEQSQIVMAMLADYPFEAFEEDSNRLLAYAPKGEYENCASQVDALLQELGVKEVAVRNIEQQNWNSEWESDFEPVCVSTADGQYIYIRASHHQPLEGPSIDVVVAPRMSFGTGHHTTTALMAEQIARRSVCGKVGLDMGCGTGVLAIIALRYGAERMVAVDIDDWACESCRDSAILSGVLPQMDIRCGSMDSVVGEQFDFVLANINRNILQSMFLSFATALIQGGELLMSGFLPDDVSVIASGAQEHGFEIIDVQERDGWAVVVCRKL